MLKSLSKLNWWAIGYLVLVTGFYVGMYIGVKGWMHG